MDVHKPRGRGACGHRSLEFHSEFQFPDFEFPAGNSPRAQTANLASVQSGEYFAGCFGPRDSSISSNEGPLSQRPMLMETPASRPPRSRGHSRSLSTSILSNFNFGSMRFGGKSHDELAMRAAELNHKAATHKDRVFQQPVGRWVMEDDEQYYLKPPAWKQALRRLRAQAKRHVHPAPPRERMIYYDAESYKKNFDNSGRVSVAVDEDEFEVKARVLHTKLLTKLHSKRFEDHALDREFPPAMLLRSVSVRTVSRIPKAKDDSAVPIWARRVAARPLQKLELTQSI